MSCSEPVPAGNSPPAPPGGAAAVHRHPFLVWPVARREFYTSISIALLPALIWGVMIFGFRAAEVIGATVVGATLGHKMLKRLSGRGRMLLYAHTLVSALILAALGMPFWSPLIMLGAGAMLTVLLWVFQGPGRDRIHPSVVVALALGLVVMPLLYQRTGTGPAEDAILARNRLFMGDIRNGTAQSMARWPHSGQIAGYDAVFMPRPATVVSRLIPQLQAVLKNRNAKEAFNARFDETLVADLPNIDILLLGVRPGYIGTVSSLGLLLGGFYLAYRNILRPKSVLLYLSAVALGLAILSFLPADFAHLTNRAGIGSLWRGHADKVLTLQFYQFFSGDILFAAVIILAMPGTEPVTSLGRRWMLFIAGVATPLLMRIDPNIPVATTVLLVLQPLAPLFDAFFARRSWLNQ